MALQSNSSTPDALSYLYDVFGSDFGSPGARRNSFQREVFGNSDTDAEELSTLGARHIRRSSTLGDAVGVLETDRSSEMSDVSYPPRSSNCDPHRGSSTNVTKGTGISRSWNIRSIVVGDGSTGRDGRTLMKGHYYGSSALRGNHASFHEIDPDSLHLCDRTEATVTWSVRPTSERARRTYGRSADSIDPPSVVRSDAPTAQIPDVHMNELWNWCEEFPGVSVLIGGPMARLSSGATAPFLLQGERKMVSNRENATVGGCVQDSVVNAISTLCGRAEARRAKEELDKIRGEILVSVRRVAPLLHKLSAKVELRHLPYNVKKASKAKTLCLFEWLSEEAKGVWLVRLVESGVVDHCVAVDTREAHIFDSAEIYPLKLRADILRMCGGEDATNVKIVEICEVFEQK